MCQRLDAGKMRYKQIIWDWNGTLIDDTWMCVEVINELLSKYNKPILTVETYHKVFDFPVKDYYRRIGFDFNETPFEVVGTEFMNRYWLCVLVIFPANLFILDSTNWTQAENNNLETFNPFSSNMEEYSEIEGLISQDIEFLENFGQFPDSDVKFYTQIESGIVGFCNNMVKYYTKSGEFQQSFLSSNLVIISPFLSVA